MRKSYLSGLDLHGRLLWLEMSPEVMLVLVVRAATADCEEACGSYGPMRSEPLPDSLVIFSGLAVSGHQAEVRNLGPPSLWPMQSPRVMSGPVVLIQPKAVLKSTTYVTT